ncbi:MAG: NADP-dependent oxidoreductase [Solirubrobacteraceae bacterium]
MRALSYSEFGGPEVLRVVDVAEPDPGPGQIRIAVHAAAVNPIDWKRRSGMMGGELPAIPGFDAAGVVEETGERVFGQAVGGAYAESAVLAHWATMPDGLSFEEAAGFVMASETALRSLGLIGLSGPNTRQMSGVGTRQETVVIVGASGGVGSAAVQFARARRARVIGTASAANHDYLRELGAEPIAHDALATLDTQVDAGLDTAGRGAVRDLIALTGDPARVVTIADFGAGELGVHVSSQASAWHALDEAATLFAAGRFTLPVAGVFTFDDAAEAHRISEAGHVRGKLILRP